ncbi:MAG TPA: Rieske 2Fe-2S domain-containing protein [Gammaproteobacteria bacterium]|nr:Rieske 2Fe-2S domain-containing protein [Gammaproteobacteria bacterium]
MRSSGPDAPVVTPADPCGEPATRHAIERRTLLGACCGLALGGAVGARADDTSAPRAEALAPPQLDDVLVFAFGSRAGQPIAPADLAPGAKQTLAFPMDTAARVVRDGTRLNQLIVVRLGPEALTTETRARSADGVVAYSGVCTHTGCDVTDWLAAPRHFKCPCHESEYDPGDAARVLSGPAPWPLAALPLKIAGGVLAVAAPFVGNVGFAQPGGPSGP